MMKSIASRCCLSCVQAVVDTYSVQEAIGFICDTRGELVLPVSKAAVVCLAVTELITNACKHAFLGRSPGVVRLLLDGATDQVLIRVEDDGVGMPVVPGKSEHRGIGMILVDSLARSLAADIRIDSDPSGTCFTIAVTKPESAPDLSHALIADWRSKEL
jgi:two-component sensor histidine kinase